MANRGTHREIAAWIFGALTLIFLMVVFFMSGQEVSQLQHRIAGLIGAAMAAFFGFFFTGSMKIVTEGQLPKWGKVSIQAGSGMALFVFVLIWWGSDAAPVKVTAEPQRKTTVEVDASEGGQAATNVVSGGIDVGDGGSLTITAKTGPSDEDVKRIVKTVFQHAEAELLEQLQSTAEERDRLEKELASAIERLSKSESEASKATLEELRSNGDTTKLLAFLKEEHGRIEDRVRQDREEQLQIKREIATVAYLTGEIETAEEAVRAILAIDPDDIDAVNRLGHIQRLRGDLVEAEGSYKKVLTLADGEKVWQAKAYGNLGNVFRTRGDVDEAEAMYRKALELNEELGNKKGMAASYGKLGNVFFMRGDLDEAEAMYRKSLEIEEQLERKEGMAVDYGNLGNVFLVRGELDEAEAMYHKALVLNEQLGRKEGMAINCGNLGIVFETRGELDEAETMYRRALEIDVQLGRKEGMANQYGNLGNVFKARGELDEAEAMYRKALDLHEELETREGMAADYGNLGNVFQTRGDLDAAEAMYRQALEINEQLGNKPGLAADYASLGALHEERREFDRAREDWTQALDLYKQMGIPDKIALVQSWLDRLPETGGDAPPG